jgi:DNA topoisomerase-1
LTVVTKPSTPSQRGKRRARKVGLYYVNDFDKGIERRRKGKGFTYVFSGGRAVRAARTLQRIGTLVIPPAWEEVWICPKPNGHIQAVGRDEAGRKQYLYHERWQAVSTETKFDRMQLMAELLPRIRRRVRKDLRQRKLTEERVLAAIVRLLDKARIRVGNPASVKTTNARGATTLANKHVEVSGIKVGLAFPGKSGKFHEVEIADQRVAKVVSLCRDLPGQYLFSLCDDQGVAKQITSTRVNAYLQEVAEESVTAKDFRTWWGSVIALSELKEMPADLSKTARKRAVVSAVRETAADLGNTMAVCRRSYIHPGLLTAAETGELRTLVTKAAKSRKRRRELAADEQLLAALLPYLDFS